MQEIQPYMMNLMVRFGFICKTENWKKITK